jgi:hypothetical protein
MSLDPLKNPLERLKSLPTGMNWRKNPLTNDPTWSGDIQYYANDVVFDPVDEGAYVMTGSGATLADSETAVRGGFPPSGDTTGNWVSLAPSGVGLANYQLATAPSFTMTPAAAGVVTVVGGDLVIPAIATGFQIWHFTLQYSIAGAGTGIIVFNFIPTVNALKTVALNQLLDTGDVSDSVSGTVVLGQGSTGCPIAAAYGGTQPTSIGNLLILWTRIR